MQRSIGVHGLEANSNTHMLGMSSREPCIRALGASGPRIEKNRIEMDKGKVFNAVLHLDPGELGFSALEGFRAK